VNKKRHPSLGDGLRDDSSHENRLICVFKQEQTVQRSFQGLLVFSKEEIIQRQLMDYYFTSLSSSTLAMKPFEAILPVGLKKGGHPKTKHNR